jgi:hypothetical protein
MRLRSPSPSRKPGGSTRQRGYLQMKTPSGTAVLLSVLQLGDAARYGLDGQPTDLHVLDSALPCRRPDQTYTIFEGTSEIQRLVIARAISGVHIN